LPFQPVICRVAIHDLILMDVIDYATAPTVAVPNIVGELLADA